ncbi:MAG: DUF3046 domain-containing protein [Microbacteriaceae bacterium]|nr:DUF3046 domain-containing protein [Microbacteriaceae bacterium]
MRIREFWFAVETQFGKDWGQVVVRDVVLGGKIGSLTASEALDSGVPARDVWEALCEAMNVPDSDRHGRGLPEKSFGN